MTVATGFGLFLAGVVLGGLVTAIAARAVLGARRELDRREQSIAALLAPIRDGLATYDRKLADIERSRERSFGEIAQRLRQVGEASDLLKDQTRNLVDALRSPGVRGRWGELQLRRVCELAGMLAHCDFDEQVGVATEEGRRRPDLVVRLAGGRSIVVDAKVPLEAYLAAVNASDDVGRKAHLRRHARQVRAHVEHLARKAYWERFVPAPEFVVLFLPGEVFFSAALQEDPGLLEAGAADRVLLATPTTLIALLRTAAVGWRQESVAKNAEEIGRLGRELYERIARVAESFEHVGTALDAAVRAYNEGVGSLEARLLVTARRLNAQGVQPAREVGSLSPVDVVPRTVQAGELRVEQPDDVPMA